MAEVVLKVGILGGTGLDDPDILHDRIEKVVTTPFGPPSDVLITGSINKIPCVLLARHGRKHDKYPSSVNYRANLYALRQEGCTHILVTTACGSLRQEVEPGDIVILDSFIDRTTRRISTFYDGSCEEFKGVCHIPMSPAFCESTRQVLIETCEQLGIKHHPKGTMVTIEGPRFSSRAESLMHQQWGGTTINMTTSPEVTLAKELGLCYAALGLVTDYDCWKESEEGVSVEMVMSTFKANAQKAMRILLAAIPNLLKADWLSDATKARDTAKHAIM